MSVSTKVNPTDCPKAVIVNPRGVLLILPISNYEGLDSMAQERLTGPSLFRKTRSECSSYVRTVHWERKADPNCIVGCVTQRLISGIFQQRPSSVLANLVRSWSKRFGS